METAASKEPESLPEALTEISRLRAEVVRLEEEVARLRHGSPQDFQGEFDAALWGFPSEPAVATPGDLTPGSPRPQAPLAEIPTNLDDLRLAIAQVRTERERSEAALLALLGPGPRPRSRPTPEASDNSPVARLGNGGEPGGPLSGAAAPVPARLRRTILLLTGWTLVLTAALFVYFAAPSRTVGDPDPGAVMVTEPGDLSPSPRPPAPALANGPQAGRPSEGSSLDAEPPPEPFAEAAPTLEVKLVADRQAWLRVLVDGDRVLERAAAPGEELTFTAAAAIVVRAGDAGAIRITVDGTPLGSLGPDGAVVTRQYVLREQAAAR